MNRIYKVIWSKVKHQYVVVSELAHSCTKSAGSRVGRSAAAVLAALVLTTGLCAAPVQAEELTDPYALLNAQVEETNNTSSDKIVTLASNPQAKSVAPLANEDEGQPGEGGSSTVTTPDGQHTIYNEEGFYAHNGQGTYNSLTKDGLFVGGTDDGEGLYVDNDGNIYTDGNAEVEGSLSAANRNFEVNEDGTLYARAGQSQFQVRGDLIGIQQGNSYIAVTEEDGAVFSNGTEGKETQINGDVVTTGTVNTTNLNAGKADIEGTITAGSAVIEGAATVGGSLTAGSIQTEGQLKAGSAVIDGNTTIGGIATVGGLTTEGTVTAGTVNTTNLNAGKADIEGTMTAGSAAIRGNADITGTATVGGLTTEGKVTATNAKITNLKAGKADVEGIVRGGSFANTNDSFTVDDQGDVKAHNVTLTGTLGVAGATTLDNTLSVTGETTLTGALKANGTATFAQGASMDGKKITNVGEGEVNATSTDAVNGSQLKKVADTVKTYQAGNGIAIAKGDTQTPTISAKAADGGNIVVNADGISLAKEVSGLTSLGTDALTVNNNATLSGTLGVAGATTLDSTLSVTGETTLTGALKANGTATFAQGASMGGKKITNVGEGEVNATSKDAVNGSQLQKVADTVKTYQAGNGIAIANGATQTPTISAKAAGGGNIVVNADGISLAKEVSGLTSIGTETITANGAAKVGSLTTTGAISGGSVTAGTGLFSTSVTIGNTASGLKLADGEITGLATSKINASTDAVNVEYLQDYVSKNGTGKTYTAGNGIVIDGSNVVSVKNGNGIGFDARGNVEVKAAQDGNIVVDTKGVSLSKTVSGLTSIDTGTITASGAASVGSLTTTGAISGGSVTAETGLFSTSVTIGNATNGLKLTDGEITGLVTSKIGASTDAVNVEYLQDYVSKNGTGKTYTAGNGIVIDGSNVVSVKNGNGIGFDGSGNVEVKAAQDGNIVVDTKGVSLSKTVSGLTSIGTGALTATGDVTAASFKVDDKTYISSTGLNANNQKITNVEDGKLVSGSKDAVNAGQLYDVKQSIKTYVDGNGITIAGDDNKISVNTGKGLEIADDKVQVKVNGSNLTLDETNGLGLSTTLTGLESIKTGTLNATGAVTAGSFSTTNGSATIGNIIINANNGGKITGLTGGVVNENSTEAINGGQLWKVQQDIQGISDLAVTYRNKDKQAVDLSYNNGNGTTITNVAAGDISRATSMDAVNGGQLYATNQIVGDGDYSSNNFLIDSTAAGGMDLTEAASALDKAIGTLKFTGNDAVLADSYTNVTDAVSTLDRNIGSLKFTGRNVLSAEKMPSATSALDALDRAVGSVDFKETPYLGTAYTNLTSATDKLASAMSNIAGIVGIRTDASGNPMNIDWGDDHPKIDPSASVVTAIKGIDTRVMTLETAGNALSAFSRSNISTLSALSNMDVSAVNALSSLSADDLSKLSEISVASDGSGAAETSGTNTTNNSGRPDRGPGSGADDSISHDGDTVTVDNNVKVTGDTDLQGNLNVGGDATFNGNVDMNGTLNMNGNKITGVADGEISATSTDAVNGSQLWQTNQQVAANTENIGILGSAVNKLGDRIERVGAGAAALAALHPLDFDPDNKLDFAAGFGNYRGASAVAVGAFYRPSENVMFSVGGAFGGGEDMVNAGVSFKVGAGSGSATTSRTAMAKSLKSMQEVVASQDAQLAQQREQIDKLTAMVELLMEQNGQAQPKDGDAQAGQPQQ